MLCVIPAVPARISVDIRIRSLLWARNREAGAIGPGSGWAVGLPGCTNRSTVLGATAASEAAEGEVLELGMTEVAVPRNAGTVLGFFLLASLGVPVWKSNRVAGSASTAVVALSCSKMCRTILVLCTRGLQRA